MAIFLVKNDIRDMHCDAIVTATDPGLSGGFGFPPDEIIRIAISEARKIPRTYNMDVFIITHRQSTFNMSTMMYEDLLTRNSKFDIIVEYCIENGIYDINDVDDLLYKNIRDTLQN